MRFLSLSPLAALGLVLLVLAAVVTAYLLKPGRRRVAVASLALWARVLGAQRRAVQRWRWWLSLLLAGVIGVALALALSRPEVAGIGGHSQRVVLILDNSPSMAARTLDGGTRWQHAVTQARALVAGLGGASEVMVLDSMGRAPLTGYGSPSLAWRQIGELPLVRAGRAALPPLPEGLPARVHWFTDGVALPAAPAWVRVHSLFEPAANVGITAFEARRRPGAGGADALLQVTNGGTRPVRARVVVNGPDYAWQRDLDLPAGESQAQSLDLSSGGAGVYRARVQTADDALATDDEGFAVVPVHAARSVLLVSAGDSRLADSLRALPGLRVRVVAPGAYPSDEPYDAYVFDGHVPARMPPAGALLFASAPAGARTVGDAVVTAWNSLHPLSQGVAWSDLRVRAASLARPPSQSSGANGVGSTGGKAAQDGSNARAAPSESSAESVKSAKSVNAAESLSATDLVSAAALAGNVEGGLITLGETPARWVRVGFALRDSNFTLQSGFPVFLGNAIDWLSAPSPSLTRQIGNIAAPVVDARVFDADGKPVATFNEPAATRFEAMAPAVYTLKTAAGEVTLAANVIDPDFTRINASTLTPQRLSRAQGGSGFVARAELWTLLLALAAVLVLVEWGSFTRKVTV